MEEFRVRFEADIQWLRESNDLGLFHQYAIATLRQLGANAELASTFCGWLGGLDVSAEAFGALAGGAKSLQFKLARVAAGRNADLRDAFAAVTDHWRVAFSGLASELLS